MKLPAFIHSWISGWRNRFWPEAKEEVPLHMKYLIVGLGNIGSEYDNTRHNVGFEVVDQLVEKHGGTFSSAKLGALAKIKFRGRQLTVLKPSTYMNLSGKAIKYWMDKEKISSDNVLIILDDLNLTFGHLRVRDKGSDGGHNGLKNIQQVLGTTKYPRLRVGIGDDFKRGQQVDFVLGKWEADKRAGLPKILDRCIGAIEAFSFRGLKEAMNNFNGKGKN